MVMVHTMITVPVTSCGQNSNNQLVICCEKGSSSVASLFIYLVKMAAIHLDL